MAALANAKHEAFARAIVEGKSGALAYAAAGYTAQPAAAETNASRLLRKAQVAARVAELKAEAARGSVMTAQEVLEELSRLGRANMADYMRVGPDGDPVLDWSKLTRDQAAALAEVTVDSYAEPGEEAREVKRVKFKLASKQGALDLLGKHHKLYIERVEHSFSGAIAERLAAAIARTQGKPHGDEGGPDRRAARKRSPRKAARKGKRARAR